MRDMALAAIVAAFWIGMLFGILALVSASSGCGGREPTVQRPSVATATYPAWPSSCALAISDIVIPVGAALPSPLPAIVVAPGATVSLHVYEVCDGAVAAVLQ